MSSLVSYSTAFVFLWFYRYLRLIVNVISSWTFRPIPIPARPSYTSKDVTLIIPTIEGNGDDFECTLRKCLDTNPYEIIVVTVKKNHERLEDFTKFDSRIRVLSIAKANKRRQMVRAIPEVKTDILIFADDDVLWPADILAWILAPFENPKIGGVGTSQRLKRSENMNFWTALGAFYLERRNFEISATSHIDGGVSCLSGRTVAYRTSIMQDPAFLHGFTNELWRGKHELNPDDDNFLTRWIVSHGWDSYEQCTKEAELRTTLMEDPRFLKQCLRWARSNWRSNMTSMFKERYVWKRQPWCSYALHMATFSPPALITDIGLLFLLHKAVEPALLWQAFIIMLSWMLFTKVIKLLPHFWLYPQDFVYLPISIMFGYFHGLIKVYALFTLNDTAWGSREGADDQEDLEPFEDTSGYIYDKIHLTLAPQTSPILDEKACFSALAVTESSSLISNR